MPVSGEASACLKRPFGRVLAYLDMLLRDHGLFRVLYQNLYALPGGLYRSSQPSPGQLRKYQRKLGLQSVVNLRGADSTLRYALEEDSCQALGLRLVNHRGILSRSAPEVKAIHETRAMFAGLAYPALIHCKSGADRAGFAAVLYRHFQLGESIQVALAELGWKYGHINASKTGILDFFFQEYLAANAQNPIEFMEWVENVYDRDALKARFKPQGWANFIVDTLLNRE